MSVLRIETDVHRFAQTLMGPTHVVATSDIS